MFMSILDTIRLFASMSGNTLCIADEANEYTYQQVIEHVCIAGKALESVGIKKRDRVVIHCSQKSEFLLAHLACNAIGAIAVPIEKEASAKRVSEIIEETEARVIISDAEYMAEKVVRYKELFEGTVSDFEFVQNLPSDVSEILFTTSTTGRSKGVEVTYDNNVALAENISCGTEMKENNVELIPLPLSHSHALRTFYANMLKNGTVVITNGVANIKVIYNLIKKYSVTALDLSPSAALIMLKLSRGKFSEFNEKLDYIEIGTAVLPENTKVELRKQFPNVRLYNCYGSTESGRSCTLNFNSSDDEQYCIGRPSVNAEFIVVDDEKKVVESSLEKTGLIACKGRMNMKGYWRQPELTKETLENGYIYTSDEGYISEDGRIFLLGRKGDVINYKGIKIAPDEIEEVVKKFGNVIIDCSVVPQCDEAAGQIPVLVLSLKYELDMVDFKKFLVSNIDANKMPRKIVRFDEIPRTYNGKLQRGRLVKMMEEQPERIAILG